jgi:hypothetical protein
LKQLDENCLFKIDTEGFEEHLIDAIIADPPSELSLSIHQQLMEESETLMLKLELLTEKYNSC